LGLKPDPVSVDFVSTDTVVILGKLWDKPALVDLLAQKKNVVHFNYVVLVYDLIPLLQPHLFGDNLFERYRHYSLQIIQNANWILCISKATEADVKMQAIRFDLPVPRTTVVVLGDEKVGRSKPVGKKPSYLREGELFLLCVGTVEARKNHLLIYQTYKLAAQRCIALPKIVIAGAVGWLVNDMIYMIRRDPQVNTLIIFQHHTSDDELAWLYENCQFTVYPSVCEGWGLPVRESLSYGKHCITSNTSSLPEAADGIADTVSPYDAAGFLDRIIYALHHTRQVNHKASVYEPVSWASTYQTIKGVFKVSISLGK
jgi:glycosyltransferase involved in cell wall biosynthesis